MIFFQRVDKLHHLCPTNPPPWESNSGRQGAKRKARLTGLAFAGFFRLRLIICGKYIVGNVLKLLGKTKIYFKTVNHSKKMLKATKIAGHW